MVLKKDSGYYQLGPGSKEGRVECEKQSREEMLEGIRTYVQCPTDHNTLSSDERFMSRVVTYGLSIGYCWHSQDKTGLEELRRQVDWLENGDCYFSDKLTVPSIPLAMKQDVVEDAEQRKAEEKARLRSVWNRYMESDMGKNVVVLSDATSHGGKVSSASSAFDTQGKKAALLNDTVTCPERGTDPIVGCDTSYEEGGRGIVIHDCKSTYGSVVYVSLPDTEID